MLKAIDSKLLRETGWMKGSIPPDSIVSYCEVCSSQRVHRFVRWNGRRLLFECCCCREKLNLL